MLCYKNGNVMSRLTASLREVVTLLYCAETGPKCA